MAAGDGYNQRYDDLIDGVERKVKQVDDVALWDSEISEHWWRMLDYLEMVGNNGMVLNPEKFEFCQKEIEFVGFVVTETEVKPPPRGSWTPSGNSPHQPTFLMFGHGLA